jgi:hypothetical protein
MEKEGSHEERAPWAEAEVVRLGFELGETYHVAAALWSAGRLNQPQKPVQILRRHRDEEVFPPPVSWVFLFNLFPTERLRGGPENFSGVLWSHSCC